jgi:hypothetical protein
MINTLKYAKRLEAAGFSRIQAEAQALAIQDAFDDSMHPFATKSDLNIAVTRLDAKIDGVETRLRSEVRTLDTTLRSEVGRVETTLGSSIRELQSDMRTVKWILGLMVPVLITLLIPAIQSIYLQLNAN